MANMSKNVHRNRIRTRLKQMGTPTKSTPTWEAPRSRRTLTVYVLMESLSKQKRILQSQIRIISRLEKFRIPRAKQLKIGMSLKKKPKVRLIRRVVKVAVDVAAIAAEVAVTMIVDAVVTMKKAVAVDTVINLTLSHTTRHKRVTYLVTHPARLSLERAMEWVRAALLTVPSLEQILIRNPLSRSRIAVDWDKATP